MSESSLDNVTLIAETNYRGQRRKFGIKRDDRRRHMYLIGKTGMGKSTTLENMIIQDIRAGKGVAVVDPHGDLVEKVIDYIPSGRVNDVVYFNPSDADFPIAFNVIEQVDPKYRHLVSSGLIGVFKKIWADSWGPRLEYVLRNAILALLDYPGATLLGVTRMMVDKEYRKKVITKIQDPVIKSFWVEEYSKYPDKFQVEAIAPIQNKVGQFLSISNIRNIVGQSKSRINLREIMDDRKILLLNLSKGRIGEDASALLGAMMITQMQLAAMGRIDIPESTREDFYLYVDEFQNFATESFANILSEARKYRLNLIIAHQYIEQLSDIVRAAVFGNVGTIMSFRVGAADAEFLEKEFAPVFTETDLVNLTKYDVYLKLMIDGVASEPFSATTLPPVPDEFRTDNREKVVRVSRERYATPRDVIEEKIMRWSGLTAESETEVDEATAESHHTTPADAMSSTLRPQRARVMLPKVSPVTTPTTSEPRRSQPRESVAPKPKPATPVQAIPATPPPPATISLTEALQRQPVSFQGKPLPVRRTTPPSTQAAQPNTPQPRPAPQPIPPETKQPSPTPPRVRNLRPGEIVKLSS